MNSLQTLIEDAFEQRQSLSMSTAAPELIVAIDEVLSSLDSGQFRVAEKINGEWMVNQWIKQNRAQQLRLRLLQSVPR